MTSRSLHEHSVSVVHEEGLDWLLAELRTRLLSHVSTPDAMLISRQRYRELLTAALGHLRLALDDIGIGAELRAEELRRAGDCIGRITGAVDVEDLLDVIFSEFCVGK